MPDLRLARHVFAAQPVLVLAAVSLSTGCGDRGNLRDGAERTRAPASGEAAADPTLALPPGVEAISLLGDTLRPVPPPGEALERMEARLDAAREAWEASPEDVDAIIWLGRRTAYLQRYREAIDIYSRGIALHPGDARLYRHRGHRYISTRQFDRAIDDLERAVELTRGHPDEIEPDGQPNALNIPTSTLQSNIWYHLGLAHYLKGDFARALEAYRACLDVSANPDMKVATSHWLYMTLRRLGEDEAAAAVLEPITADMEIIENDAYHRLLLLYRAELDPSDLIDGGGDALGNATLGYGIGNWHLYNGRPEEARAMFQRVLETGQWASFGYIAAEADLARMP